MANNYNTELQSNNTDLQAIIDLANSLPDATNIDDELTTQSTLLNSITTALTNKSVENNIFEATGIFTTTTNSSFLTISELIGYDNIFLVRIQKQGGESGQEEQSISLAVTVMDLVDIEFILYRNQEIIVDRSMGGLATTTTWDSDMGTINVADFTDSDGYTTSGYFSGTYFYAGWNNLNI